MGEEKYTEFTIMIKVSIHPDDAHEMRDFPDALQLALVGTPIRVNSMSVTNDTLVAEESSKQ